MPSVIDPSKPEDGIAASKPALRANLAAARDELEHGGFFRAAAAGAVEQTTRDKLRESLSVKDFGARGDVIKHPSGAVSAASPTTLTVAGASFTAADVGKYIQVRGADVGGSTLSTTIASVTSAIEVELADPAAQSVSDAEVVYGTDDTAAFKDAYDYVQSIGGGAVIIPQGTYLFYTLQMQPSAPVEFWGVGRPEIYRIANVAQQPGFSFSLGRIFNVSNNDPGRTDGLYWPRVTFRNLIIDGNRKNQKNATGDGPYVGKFAHQHHHGINVSGQNDQPFFQPVTVYDCEIRNTTGEGTSPSRGSDVTVENTTYRNCFRAGIVVAAQHNRLYARNIVSDDELDPAIEPSNRSGFFMEPETGDGFTDSQRIEIDSWQFHQGDFNISALGNVPTSEHQRPGSELHYVFRNLWFAPGNLTDQILFYNSGRARIDVFSSVFRGGRDGKSTHKRMAVKGNNIHFHACTFYASNEGKAESDVAASYYAVLIRDEREFNFGWREKTFNDCTFTLDHTVPGAATDIYGCEQVGSAPDWNGEFPTGGWRKPTVIFNNCSFIPYLVQHATNAPEYRMLDWAYHSANDGGRVRFHNCDVLTRNGAKVQGSVGGQLAYAEWIGGQWRAQSTFLDCASASWAGVFTGNYRFRDFWIESAFDGLVGVTSSNVGFQGGRTITVQHDPTLAGPVQVTDRYVGFGHHFKWAGRLAPGRGIASGSITFTVEDLSGPTTIETFTDDGAGNLTGSAGGSGTIDYTTGWWEFALNGGFDAQNGNTAARVTYQHGNQVPGIKGDVAVLEADTTQRWRCTAAHDTAATWVAA